MHEIQLDELQQVSVNTALDTTKRVVATTGPAGSGKTTIMRLVYTALIDAGYNPVIVAPTGKAARRVREATGYKASTIHMLLEYTRPAEIDEKTGKPYGITFPRRNREKPLTNDVVMADEYAMVNAELHRSLVDAMPPGARLIVYGDVAQLPPIENNPIAASEPTPFTKLLTKFGGITLEKIHRTAEDSGILVSAQRILAGRSPASNDAFLQLITDTPIDALIDAIYNQQGDAEVSDYATLRSQIITPGNKSWVGTVKLNVMLQDILNPDKGQPSLTLERNKWDKQPYKARVGDKVILTKNWYDLDCEDGTKGVFNGETGIITEISDIGEVVVDFEDRICRIPPVIQLVYQGNVSVGFPQRDLYPAFAITTHKAQGSEYQNVIYVMNKSLFGTLNRPNLYTGVTRARKHVTLITDMRALSVSLTTKTQRVFAQ